MSANNDFFEKLQSAIHRNNSLLCVGLDPHPAQIPATFRAGHDDSVQAMLAWNQAIIRATAPYAAVYKPNIAFYEAMGIAGAHLLRSTLDAVPEDIPVLLDAKRGDMGNTASAYAQAVFEQWRVDAVTLNAYLGRESLEPFLAYKGKGLFVLCHTSNSGAADFQELEISDWRTLDREPNQPLYIHLARTVTQWGANVGLVVGATFPDAIQATRAAAPDAWFLVPGIGAQQGDLAASVAAGIRSDRQGIVVSASRSLAQAEDIAAAAKQLRDDINAVRSDKSFSGVDVSPLSLPEQTLINGLVELTAVNFGDFVLASGQHSPIYIDLRLLVSDSTLLALAADAYAKLVGTLAIDRIAGVPYAALPIATALSLRTGLPMIYTRKEVKTHGLGKQVEGLWQPGDRVVMIEDVVTSGGSLIKSVQQLRELGLVVEEAVVLIDREQGGIENLADAGIRTQAVFTLSEMLDHLQGHGRVSVSTANEVRAFLQGK